MPPCPQVAVINNDNNNNNNNNTNIANISICTKQIDASNMQEFPLNIPLSIHNNVQTTNVNPTNPLKLDLSKMPIINIFGNNDIDQKKVKSRLSSGIKIAKIAKPHKQSKQKHTKFIHKTEINLFGYSQS